MNKLTVEKICNELHIPYVIRNNHNFLERLNCMLREDPNKISELYLQLDKYNHEGSIFQETIYDVVVPDYMFSCPCVTTLSKYNNDAVSFVTKYSINSIKKSIIYREKEPGIVEQSIIIERDDQVIDNVSITYEGYGNIVRDKKLVYGKRNFK